MIGLVLNIKMSDPKTVIMDIELLEASPPWSISAYSLLQENIVAEANAFLAKYISFLI